MFKYFFTIFVLVFLGIGNIGLAQDKAEFSAGMAFISSASAYKGVGSTSQVMPSISYENGRLKLGVQDGISYRVSASDTNEFRVSLAPNFQPYKSSDSDSLAGMDRDMGLDGSMSGTFEIARGSTLKLKAATDLRDSSNGHLVDLSFRQFIPLGSIPAIFSLGGKWYDSKRAQHDFGVYASEDISGREEYAPGAVAVTYISLNAFMNVTENTSAFVNISANFLPNKVVNSPIVEKDSTLSTIIGVSYRF